MRLLLFLCVAILENLSDVRNLVDFEVNQISKEINTVQKSITTKKKVRYSLIVCAVTVAHIDRRRKRTPMIY